MEDIKPIFVTSFSEKMYSITGRRCIDTILQFTPFDIIVLLEDQTELDIKSDRIKMHSIFDFDFYKNIKDNNLDLIPKHFGGHSKMKANDRNNYYNFNSVNWWKKIAAIYVANRLYKDNILVWIDADCYFKKEVSDTFFKNKFFNGCSMFFFQGKRDAVESGLVGFTPDHPIILRFFEYMQGDFPFRKLSRHDDGYILGQAIKDLKSKDAFDLNTDPFIERHPLKKFKKYFKHEKGTHRDTGIHVDTRRK